MWVYVSGVGCIRILAYSCVCVVVHVRVRMRMRMRMRVRVRARACARWRVGWCVVVWLCECVSA